MMRLRTWLSHGRILAHNDFSFRRFNGGDGKDDVLAFELSIRHFATLVWVICDPGYGSRMEKKRPLNNAAIKEENHAGKGEENDYGS